MRMDLVPGFVEESASRYVSEELDLSFNYDEFFS
jgi:hypothetical protein